ncbi:MAG TPA: geranylgeranyl reductase family protein [Acidimicrobiales bacterium]
MTSADVAVVGGGPAGAAAAIALARAGRSVVLFDKARFPRDKCCGDGLTTGALRRLEVLGLDPRSVPSWQPIRDVWVRSPSGRTVDFALPSGDGVFGVVARRVDLDAALLDVARAAGVKVHDGHAVRDVRADGESIALEVDGIGSVTVPFVVAADGMWSPVRKALGCSDEPGYLGEWHAFRQYFTGVGPAATGQLWVWFEQDLLPGYAWSFALPGGIANVGFGIHRRSGSPTSEMKSLWLDLLERPHIRSVLGPMCRSEAPHKAWPIPARIGGTELVAARGRVLFVGDAARAPDSMTGEGIGQALETGQLAAAAISRASPRTPGLVGRFYRRSVKAGLARDDKIALALSRVLVHSRGARGAVRLADATDWTRRNFARWMFEDYPRAILATPRRWHAGVLHGPGAFGDNS